MNTRERRLLIVQAHPDDAEAWSAGTLALLTERGWAVTIATLTAGGMGSFDTDERETVRIRRDEAALAAAEIGADYHCFNRRDGFLFDNEAVRMETVALIRRVHAGVVITHPPFDYHTDHRAAHSIVDAAVLLSTLPNVPTDEKPLALTPVFYHGMPMNLTDPLGFPVPEPHFFVDVTGDPMDRKMAMLARHHSQIELMRKMMGMDQFFEEMKRFNARLGAMIGVEYAECYWQHLGGGYPVVNWLQTELADRIHRRTPGYRL